MGRQVEIVSGGPFFCCFFCHFLPLFGKILAKFTVQKKNFAAGVGGRKSDLKGVPPRSATLVNVSRLTSFFADRHELRRSLMTFSHRRQKVQRSLTRFSHSRHELS